MAALLFILFHLLMINTLHNLYQSFLTPALSMFGAGQVFAVGAVPCTEGCLAVSLNPTH